MDYLSIPLIPSLRLGVIGAFFKTRLQFWEKYCFFKHKVLLIIWEFTCCTSITPTSQYFQAHFLHSCDPPNTSQKEEKASSIYVYPVLFWSMVIHSVSSPFKKKKLSPLPSSEIITINVIKSKGILGKHGSIYDKMWQICQYNCKWNKLIIQFKFIS